MISLDTNILARLLLGDDIAQLARAKALLSRAQQFTAPITVMLELVWVLEANGVEPTALADGLERLVSVPNFEPAHFAEIRQALHGYREGLDFAADTVSRTRAFRRARWTWAWRRMESTIYMKPTWASSCRQMMFSAASAGVRPSTIAKLPGGSNRSCTQLPAATALSVWPIAMP